MDNKIYDVVVIGAGPGGISAAIYAKRSNLEVLLLEKGIPGGQLNQTSDVENYPGFDQISGEDLANKMFDSVKHLDIEYKRAQVKDIVKVDDIYNITIRRNEIKTKTIIIASGCSPRHLDIKGEESFSGRGVSYCAICDGNFFKDKNIVVIGGGDSAIEEASYLANIGKKVTIIHRRDEFRAQPHLMTQLKKYNNVSFMTPYVVNEINGDTSVNSVSITNTKNGETKVVETDSVFIYVGMIPNNSYLNNLSILNENGWIETNEIMHTSQKGIFAIGDIREREKRQIVFATNDGAIAGLEAYKYLKEDY